jgi:prophage regulatory protein
VPQTNKPAQHTEVTLELAMPTNKITPTRILLNKEEAADYIGISVSTLERLVREKKFAQPRQISGRRVGFLLADLDEWINALPPSNLPPPPMCNIKNKAKASNAKLFQLRK